MAMGINHEKLFPSGHRKLKYRGILSFWWYLGILSACALTSYLSIVDIGILNVKFGETYLLGWLSGTLLLGYALYYRKKLARLKGSFIQANQDHLEIFMEGVGQKYYYHDIEKISCIKGLFKTAGFLVTFKKPMTTLHFDARYERIEYVLESIFAYNKSILTEKEYEKFHALLVLQDHQQKSGLFEFLNKHRFNTGSFWGTFVWAMAIWLICYGVIIYTELFLFPNFSSYSAIFFLVLSVPLTYITLVPLAVISLKIPRLVVKKMALKKIINDQHNKVASRDWEKKVYLTGAISIGLVFTAILSGNYVYGFWSWALDPNTVEIKEKKISKGDLLLIHTRTSCVSCLNSLSQDDLVMIQLQKSDGQSEQHHQFSLGKIGPSTARGPASANEFKGSHAIDLQNGRMLELKKGTVVGKVVLNLGRGWLNWMFRKSWKK